MLEDLQFRYRGLVFGAGTDIHVNRAEGFEGFEARTSDTDLPRGDGAVRGRDHVAPRTVAFQLGIIGLTGGDVSYERYWAMVREAFRPSQDDDDVLTFKRPGEPERYIRCRPISLARVEEYRRFNVLGFPPVVLRAVDPRIYSTEAQAAMVTPHAFVDGASEMPIDLPFDFGGGSTNEAVAVNAGTATAYPLLRFYAPPVIVDPVYYPGDDIFPGDDIYPNEPEFPGSVGTVVIGTLESCRLTNRTTGQELEIITGITSGQVLTADMEAAVTGANRLVVSVDGSSRYGDWQLPREAFGLAPGSNSLRLQVTGTAATARCHVLWHDTWLD